MKICSAQDIFNKTSCAGGARQGMKMGFRYRHVRGDCAKVSFTCDDLDPAIFIAVNDGDISKKL